MSSYRKVEAFIHGAVVNAYSRRIAQEPRFDHVLENLRLRSGLVRQILHELLRPYGTSWMGQTGITNGEWQQGIFLPNDLKGGLESLSSRSQFLSFHLFDPLTHKRSTIDSVLSRHFVGRAGKHALAIQARYDAIERLYIQLADNHVPTLVRWLHDIVPSDTSQHFSFRINPIVDSGDWPLVEFPVEYCERSYRADEVLQKWLHTADIRLVEANGLADAILRQAEVPAPFSFLKTLKSATGFCPTIREAAAIALSFYMWQRAPKNAQDGCIMPYYFRGVVWNLPKLRELSPEKLPRPAFLAVSCTALEEGLKSEDLGFLDAFTCGLASALTICGIETLRGLIDIIFLPHMLRHEVGNRMLWIADKLLVASKQTRLARDTREDLRYLVDELHYTHALVCEVASFSNPDEPLKDVLEREESDLWFRLFCQMVWRREMEKVALIVGRERQRVSPGDPAEVLAKLQRLRWPPPVCVRVHYLRQILTKLIENSFGDRSRAQSVELRIDTVSTPEGYIDISIWDDGSQYLPDEAGPQLTLGHKVIDKIIREIQRKHPSAGFLPPSSGAAGQDKVFRVVLPVVRQAEQHAPEV